MLTPTVAIPGALPVDAVLEELARALADHGAAVLIAPPGAGKSTRVPPALLDRNLAGAGRVVVLQPRRVAARAVARRIAAERGVALGDEVGYRVRFENRTSPATRIEVLTEGLLTRRLQADPFLEGVGCVVLDEFHERSVQLDLALGLLQEVRREVRPDLRLLLMSATLDPAPLVAYFGGELPVVRAEGRVFPVTVVHDPEPVGGARGEPAASLIKRVAAAVRRALSEQADGHVLVFLPGAGEIAEVRAALGELDEVEVLPLHGSLPAEAQDRALAPADRRRVVLATNLAETSVTLDGVRVVIDSGLERQSRFDPALGLERLETVRISRASAEQRAGRAGRTAPGLCRRLWTAAEQRALAEFTPPEVRRADLAGAALELHGWGLDPARFAWLEAPPAAALARAEQLLGDGLGALRDGRLTPLGHTLLRLPLHPRLARVVVAGHFAGRLSEAATVAALASERDLLGEGPAPWATSSDLALRLELLAELERGGGTRRAAGLGLDPRAVRAVQQARDQLVAVAVRELGPAPRPSLAAPASEEELARLLLTAFPDRVGRRREPGSRRYRLVGGRGARLDECSGVRDAELLLAVTLQAAPRGERAEHRIRVACALDPAWLPTTSELTCRFDEQREAVFCSRVTRFFDLVLAEQPSGQDADPQAIASQLARALQLDPRRALQPDEAATDFLARVRSLAGWWPELALPTFPELEQPASPEAEPGPLLLQLCAGCRSFVELRRRPLLPRLHSALRPDQLAELARLAPERLTLPGGASVRLRYSPGQPPVLAATIQRLFGLTRTPTVAGGRAQVLVHLLAPNQRPVQVTQDLASFWSTTYHEVRRVLRGRYPRHPWPEDPSVPLPERPPRERGPSR